MVVHQSFVHAIVVRLMPRLYNFVFVVLTLHSITSVGERG